MGRDKYGALYSEVFLAKNENHKASVSENVDPLSKSRYRWLMPRVICEIHVTALSIKSIPTLLSSYSSFSADAVLAALAGV